MIVHTPGSSKIQPSAELIVPHAIGRNCCVLIQKGICCTELQAREFSDTVVEFIYWPEYGRERIRMNKRIGGYLRQSGRVYVELLSQLVGVPLDLRWLARLRSGP